VARRRSEILLLAAVAISVTAVVAQRNTPDAVRNPDAAAIAAGQRVFNQACQACHGPAGQGDRGPALNTPTFAHGSEDTDLFRTIRNGVPGTGMPPFERLTDEEVWQLVSYIHGLQGTAPAAGATRAPAGGDAAAGEGLFFGRGGCASCHEINGRGGVLGPDLSGAGRLSPVAVRQKITDPNGQLPQAAGARGGGGRGGAPAASTLIVKTEDGREIRGLRRNEDTFSLQLVDASGQLHLLDKLKLASVRVDDRSMMPSDYSTRLSSAEITDLVAYLQAQSGRDLSKTAGQPMAGGVSYDRLRDSQAEPQNWMMYWGDYQGTHFSRLKQIDSGNVKNLQGAWGVPTPGNVVLEATPLVVDGVMYVTTGGDPLTVLALDARTGRQIWRYSRAQKVKNPYEINPYNRGVAVLGRASRQ
jgi:putative heme-binding domain-containing protein